MKRLALSGTLLILLVGFGLLRSPFAERSNPAPQTTFSEEDIKTLYRTRGCTSCHDMERTLVGPSLRAIAARYEATPEAETILLSSLRNGSQGKWGTATMLVYDDARLPEHEAEAMLAWLLALDETSQP